MSSRSLLVRFLGMTVAAGVMVSMLALTPAYADNNALTLNTCFGSSACTGGLSAVEDSVTVSEGSTVRMSATLSAAPDAGTSVEVLFEIESGPNDLDAGNSPGTPDLRCSIPSTTTFCTVSFPAVTQGTDITRSWISGSTPDLTEPVIEGPLAQGGQPEPDKTDAVQDTVGAGSAAQVLDCDDPTTGGGDTERETVATNGAPTSTHVVYTCTVTAAGVGVPAVHVDGENITSGVNDVDAGKVTPADFSCDTNAQGACSITVPDGSLVAPFTASTAIFCFWIDSDGGTGDNAVNDANVSDGAGCGEAVDAPENDNTTDTASVTWVPPAVSSVDVADEDQSPVLTGTTTDDVTIKVADQFGNGISGQDVDFKIFSGPNRTVDGTATTCTTGVDGQCKIIVTNAGSLNGMDEWCVWLDTNHNHIWAPGADPGGDPDDGGACNDTSGANSEPQAPGDDGGHPFTDRGRITWSGGNAAPTQLDVTAETQSKSPGQIASLTATVLDEHGQPLKDAVVNFEITGAGDPDSGNSPGSPDRACTTDVNGVCSIAGTPGALGSSTGFTSSTPGATTTIIGWTAVGGPLDPSEGQDEGASPGVTPEPDTTDVATVSWGPANTTLTASVSPAIGTWGTKPTVTGTLSSGGAPVTSATISVWRSVAGASFQNVGSASTNSSGIFSFQDPTAPSANATYRGVFAGTSVFKPATSPEVSVAIRVGIPWNQSAYTLPRGGVVYFNGRVLPEHPGRKVVFQIYDGVGHVWKNLAWITLNSTSSFKIGYKLNVAGSRLFRVAFASDADHAWNLTPNRKVSWT